MKLTIPNQEVIELLKDQPLCFPKYTTQLMNLANQNSQGTRARVVGQMSDLIQEFPHSSLDDWEEWYLDKHPEAIDNATEKVYAMINRFKEAIIQVDKELVRNWITDLVIYKTYCGLKFQEAILKKVSLLENTEYRLATPAEESKGIDGLIGEKPVSIKPISYKGKLGLNENIDVSIIYYDKKKNGIKIEYIQ